ncbi:MAG TPA: hypothetical protein VHJ78_08350, partial [Actinomycetota bacterium]|nr:hypothetical protein [Actinomycetota bacterium]
ILALVCWGPLGGVTTSPYADILAAVTLVSLNRLVFSLIPVALLDGYALFHHHRSLWAALYGASLLVFLLLVLLPATREAPSSSVGAAAVPFVIFAGLSLAVWAWFRRTDVRSQPA